MFVEEFEKLSRGEQNQFKNIVNDVLYKCFIVRKSFDKQSNMNKINPSYLYIERHFDLFNDYLQYMDMEIVKDDDNGVIFLTSEYEKNRLRLDSVTTLIVYALRSYYETKLGQDPNNNEVYIDSVNLKLLLKDLGLSTANKRLSMVSIAAALRQLDMFNIICKAKHSYSDASYSFYILPSIRYVISNAKLNALYDSINNTSEEENEDDGTLFANQGGNE